jgi:hypothetical protein
MKRCVLAAKMMKSIERNDNDHLYKFSTRLIYISTILKIKRMVKMIISLIQFDKYVPGADRQVPR